MFINIDYNRVRAVLSGCLKQELDRYHQFSGNFQIGGINSSNEVDCYLRLMKDTSLDLEVFDNYSDMFIITLNINLNRLSLTSHFIKGEAVKPHDEVTAEWIASVMYQSSDAIDKRPQSDYKKELSSILMKCYEGLLETIRTGPKSTLTDNIDD
jgi:hypothetical protein